MQPLGENTVNTPAFLGKLWKMVNDPSTNHLICWSPSGTSFVIQNQAQFWYELLPLYYKHNNMSSFVRQLNMYGFHKLSTVENGTMDADKDEIQFMHPFFVKDKPDLLINIKRKATAPKSSNENGRKPDEISKVLTDVKQLRGRQASVDNQLSAMKQENALLWREVAILRQKHLKQQKIVNKLIQFLVTLVQPSRMTVGVKRGYQLMLNESPNKKAKVSNNNKNNSNVEGPTIHELDNELDLAPNLYDEDSPVVEESHIIKGDMIDSPAASTGSQTTDANSPLQSQLLCEDNGDECSWDKPEYVTITVPNTSDDLLLVDSDLQDENLLNALENEVVTTTIAPIAKSSGTSVNSHKVFLNPSTQNTLLSNLMKNNNPAIITTNKNDKKNQNSGGKIDSTQLLPPTEINGNKNNMTVATLDKNVCDVIKSLPGTSDCYPADLSNHIEATQNELEQFKDILNGYNSFVDANALLGLFNDNSPVYDDLNMNDDRNENLIDSADPLVSGSELAPYGGSFDFTELFDDSIDVDNNSVAVPTSEASSSTVNTPQIVKEDLLFPAIHHK